MEDGTFFDYYDFLMISPTADRQMVDWAARLLLTRYDPEKSKTPDEAKYKMVCEAYQALVDPKRRSAFDEERLQRGDSPITTEQTITRQDVAKEVHRRRAIMSVLYARMITQPHNPDLSRAEIARLSGVAAPDLEFALWFLREKGWMGSSQGGAYVITAKGVEAVEADGFPVARETTAPKPLPASQQPSSTQLGATNEFRAGLGALGSQVAASLAAPAPATSHGNSQPVLTSVAETARAKPASSVLVDPRSREKAS